VSGAWERDRNGNVYPTLQGAASQWAVPKVLQGGPNSNREARRAGGPDLQEMATQWEAPSVAVTDGSRMARGGDRSDELLLTGQANEAAKMWAGPLAQNHKGSGTAVHRPDNGKLRDDILSFQAEQLFLPPSFPAQPTADGSTCSTASPNSNQPSAKRKLNPIFVEALMRWPTGLSGFERQETAWTQWWQLQRSYLSALDWGSSETEVQHDLFA